MNDPVGPSPTPAPPSAPTPSPAPASPSLPPQPSTPIPQPAPQPPLPESRWKRHEQRANNLGGCAQALAAIVIAGFAGWWALSEWHEAQSFELQKRFTAPAMQVAYQRLFDMQICNWRSAESGFNYRAFSGSEERVGADEDLTAHLFFFRDARICVEGNVCSAERTCGDFAPWAEYLNVTLGDTLIEQRLARNSRRWGSEFNDFLGTCQKKGYYSPSKPDGDAYFRYEFDPVKRVPVTSMTGTEPDIFQKIEQFRNESLKIDDLQECLSEAQAGGPDLKVCGGGARDVAQLQTSIKTKRIALRNAGPYYWTSDAACKRLDRKKADKPQDSADTE